MMKFGKTRQLEQQMDQYLDKISEAGIVFKQGIKCYLSEECSEFDRYVKKIRQLEHEADLLRKAIEIALYTQTLIPESRGDVLALLETSDDAIDRATDTLVEFGVENPYVPEKFHKGFRNLARTCVKAQEEMVLAMRAFLRDPLGVRNYLHKVSHWEEESDLIAFNLKKEIFEDTELELSQKIHLRYFTLHIDLLADKAEDVADRLAIYTIKRSM